MKRIVVEVVKKNECTSKCPPNYPESRPFLGICYPEDQWRMPILYLFSFKSYALTSSDGFGSKKIKKTSFITPLKHFQKKCHTDRWRKTTQTQDQWFAKVLVWSTKLYTLFQSIWFKSFHTYYMTNHLDMSFLLLGNAQPRLSFLYQHAELPKGPVLCRAFRNRSGLVQLPNKVVALHSLEPSAPALRRRRRRVAFL